MWLYRHLKSEWQFISEYPAQFMSAILFLSSMIAVITALILGLIELTLRLAQP